MSFLKQRAESLTGLLFPEKCIACGCALDGDSVSDDFLLSRFFCKTCAPEVCRAEKDGKLIAAPLSYEGPVREAMQRLKFSSDISSVRFFSEELEREIRTVFYGIPFDLVTCVPATEKSIASRGYNQSRLIAEGIDLGVNRDFNLLRKNADTGVQHLLSAEERRSNIASAYRMNRGRDISGLTILLIDDIYTTGATCDACRFVLENARAKDVYIACAAKSPARNGKSGLFYA